MKNRLKKTVISYLILVSLLFCVSISPVSAASLQGPNIIANVAYYIRNAHSGLYLDVDHAGTTSGTNVIQYNLTGDPNQKWKIHSLGNGYYVIRPMHASGLALDVIDGGTSSNVGVWNVGTANSSSIRTSAQWTFAHSSSGGTIIKSRCSNSTMVLEVYYSSMENCGNVTQYYHTDDDNRNDEWILEPIHGFTGNAALSWTVNSQAVNPTDSQEYMFTPYRGNFWFDFYHSYSDNTVKSTVDFWFTQANINEIVRRSQFSWPEYFDFDVTSHRSGGNDAQSPLSAYAVLTNMPNPKLDIESDLLTDENYEESEAACLSPNSFVAEKKYIMVTYWHDFRNGAANDSGWITATPEMSRYLPIGEDLNTSVSGKGTISMSYGAEGGYK